MIRCTYLAVSLGMLLAGSVQAEAPGAGAHATRRPALPRFEGPRLVGEGAAGTDLFRLRRGLVYVFATSDESADAVASLVKRIAHDARGVNVGILGVNRDLQPARALPFVRRHGFAFPIVRDRDLGISRKLRVPPGVSSVLVVDARGFIVGGFSGSDAQPGAEAAWEAELRRALRLESLAGGASPTLGLLPKAPEFRVTGLAGESVSHETLAGRVTILVFFLPTCPHCHDLLRFLAGLERRLAHPDLGILAVSVRNRPYVIRDMVEELEWHLPVYVDPERVTQRAFDHHGSVPDTIVIDRQGRIVGRHAGVSPRTEVLLLLVVREALGVENPIVLDSRGYSGSEICAVCHRDEHGSWMLTSHAWAFDTLVEHGEDQNPECLACHTVGWREPGGYAPETPAPWLEGVGCESCHRRGGPHQSEALELEEYAAVCDGCHTPEHSLRFDFQERLPLVSHEPDLALDALTLEARRALLQRRDRRERKLFDTGAYVGSESCRECHPVEFEGWAGSVHARAFESLKRPEERDDPGCLACHTTGFREEGGFPAGGERVRHVGCESCHGPGGEHVREDRPKRGTSLRLADKCDSCVILQICGSCHDDHWDPEFEFRLMDKLARSHHGTGPAVSPTP